MLLECLGKRPRAGIAELFRQLLNGGGTVAQFPFGQLQPVQGQKFLGRAVHLPLKTLVQITLGHVGEFAQFRHRELPGRYPAQMFDALAYQLGARVVGGGMG